MNPKDKTTLLKGPAEEDAGLVQRLRAGEKLAQETFVQTYAPRALAVARRLLDDESDSADAVQDAFISALNHLDQFEGNARLATWFHRIVVNASLLRLRQRQRRKERSIEELLPTYDDNGHRRNPRPAWAQTPAELCEREELRHRVVAKIAELPATFRDILMWRDIEERSTRDIAQELEESEGTVRTRLHRARQALRSLLEEEFAE